jgi:hypothetical protein
VFLFLLSGLVCLVVFDVVVVVVVVFDRIRRRHVARTRVM